MEGYRQLIRDDYENGNFVGRIFAIKDNGHHYLTEGHSSFADKIAMEKDHAFEIGSITKVFTALLIQVLNDKKKLSLNDRVKVFVKELEGTEVGEIELNDILTHYSGLERIPSNLTRSRPYSPYAGYTEELLLESLKKEKLGAKEYLYSNQGYALLGIIVSRVCACSFEEALLSEVIGPLNLNLTNFDRKGLKMATGYLPGGIPQEYWDLGCFNAAGGLNSTVEDLFLFSNAYLYPEKTKLEVSLKNHLELIHFDGDCYRLKAWWMSENKQYIWHSGATYGFKTDLFIDLKNMKSMVMMSNTYTQHIGYYSLFKNESYAKELISRPLKDVLKKYCGRFHGHSDGKDFYINFYEFKGHLFFCVDDQFPYMLEYISEDRFEFKEGNCRFDYIAGNDQIRFQEDLLVYSLNRV